MANSALTNEYNTALENDNISLNDKQTKEIAPAVAAAVATVATSVINNVWNQYNSAKQFERSKEQWEMENEYNTPTNQVARLRAAGLNVLNYGLDGNSAYQMSAPQMAQTSDLDNPVAAYNDARLAEKQMEVADAEIAKKRSETDRIELDNQFARDTMAAREEGVELANQLTKENIKKIEGERDKIVAEIKKIEAETENEFEKKLLIQAQTRLAEMNAKEIAELLPLKKALMNAQTMAQKAQAAAAFANAAMTNGLIDAGIIDKQIAEYEAKIRATQGQAAASEARAAMDAWKTSVMSGHAFDYIIENPKANELEKGLAGFFNGIFNVGAMITSTLGNIIHIGG